MRLFQRVLSVLAIICSMTLASAQSSPEQLYSDLAHSIKVLQGTVFLDVSAGVWKMKTTTGLTLIWKFDQGTRVQADVDYEDGVLQKANLTFKPAAHVWVKDPQHGFSAGVRSISYDNLGDASAQMTIDNGSTANPNLVQSLDRSLRLSRTSDGILLGKPFVFITSSQPCTDPIGSTCSASSPFISEIRFETLDPQHPGLNVLLKGGAAIHFSKRGTGLGTYDNAVVLDEGSGFTFSQIDYMTDNKSIFAVLDNLDLRLQSGVLNGRDVGLVLSPGTRLHFQNVALTKNGTSATVNASDGHLTAGVGVGSTVNFSTGVGNASSLSFNNGSQIDLLGFYIGIDDGHKTTFVLGGGSTFTAQVASGKLGVGNTGFLSLGSGTVAAQLDGEWDSGSHDGPRTDLKITTLDVKLDGGILDLNSDSHLKIASGTVKASNLLLRTFEFSGITGAVSTLNVQLAEDTVFGIPNGIQVTTGPGAVVSAADPADPLVFTAGASFPVGSATLDLPFKEMFNSKIESMVLRDGKAHFHLANLSDGSIVGDHGSINGTGTMQASDLALKWTFNITDLTIEKRPGKNANIQGFFTATIMKGLDFTYTSTPIYHTPGHDDLRIYPITIEARIPQDISVPQSRITFNDMAFSLADMNGNPITVTFPLIFIVPPGRGEHQQPDDQDSTADGTHGPDEDQHRQEVMTDTYPACRVHLYAAADTYNVSTTMLISASDGQITINLAHLQPDKEIGWSRDGCDTPVLGAIAGAIAGTLFSPGPGTVIGAIAGYVVGGDLANVVHARIQSAIAERIQGLNIAWHFQL